MSSDRMSKRDGRRTRTRPANNGAAKGATAVANTDAYLKSLPPGSWVAWDRNYTRVLAAGADYTEVLRKAAKAGETEPYIELAPGFRNVVADPTFAYFERESPDILEDVRIAFPRYAEQWLDTPTPLFGGARPRDLVGTERQGELREYLRGRRAGIFS